MITISPQDLNAILSELKKYKSTDKTALMSSYIEQRLNKSVLTYQQDLLNASKALSSYDEMQLLKDIYGS